MVNLASGKGISRRDISRRETAQYKAFLTIYNLSEDEMMRVGNVEQQINGQLLLENGHVIPSYIPEPILDINHDWVLDFETVSQDEKEDKYKVSVHLAVDLERSTSKRKIYYFENTSDDVPDTHYNRDMKGRAGKSKHSIACELWTQEHLKYLLQEPSAQEEMEPILKRSGLSEVVLQKRYNLFLDDFRKYYENLKKNRKFTAAQRKSSAMNWLIERGRLFDVKEVSGEYITLLGNL